MLKKILKAIYRKIQVRQGTIEEEERKEEKYVTTDLEGKGSYITTYQQAPLRTLRKKNYQFGDLVGVDLNRTLLNKANFNRANLSFAKMRSAHLNGAKFRFAKLSNADLSWAHLSNTDFRGADLSDVNLLATNSRNANFSNANLRNAYFGAAFLEKANFSNANLSNAKFQNANLINAKLCGANIEGASFCHQTYGAETKNITPEQIKQAKNWEKAIYSPEFRKKLGFPPEE